MVLKSTFKRVMCTNHKTYFQHLNLHHIKNFHNIKYYIILFYFIIFSLEKNFVNIPDEYYIVDENKNCQIKILNNFSYLNGRFLIFVYFSWSYKSRF